MKKILFGCVALSVLITAVAIIELNKKPKPVVSPAQSVPETSTGTIPTRMYTDSEDKIQQAIEEYLYVKDMDGKIQTDVKADGNDFIVTITNPSDATAKPIEIRLVRIEDFAEKPQYKMTTTSLAKWQVLAAQKFENPILTADSFSEDISWVPDLGLLTNQALKVSNFKAETAGANLTIQSVVSDLLIREKDDKMDIAGSSDITELKVSTPFLIGQIPHLIQNMQVIGATQTSNPALQVLTADSASSNFSIPILGIAIPGNTTQTITAKVDSKVVFTDTLTLDTTISNIKTKNILLPMLPENITSNITVEGFSKEMLIAYINMQDQLRQMTDEDSAEGQALTEKITAAQNQILNNLSIKINKLSLSNAKAGIDVTGIIHYAETAPTINTQVAVTNFDVISPKAPSVDVEACKAAMATMPTSAEGQIPMLPAACVQQGGLLEGLRPYLDTAAHTQNEKGEPVDTFTISYAANTLSINNQQVIGPADTSSLPATEIPSADMPAAAPATPAIEDMMAEMDEETVVATPQGVVSMNEQAAVAETDTAQGSQAVVAAEEIQLEDVLDTPMAEPTADTPLEPLQPDVPVADTPAMQVGNEKTPALPTALVDSEQIVEAQKLLDNTAAEQ